MIVLKAPGGLIGRGPVPVQIDGQGYYFVAVRVREYGPINQVWRYNPDGSYRDRVWASDAKINGQPMLQIQADGRLLLSVCTEDTRATITEDITSWVPRNTVVDTGINVESAVIQRVAAIEERVSTLAVNAQRTVTHVTQTLSGFGATLQTLTEDVANRTTHAQVVQYIHDYVLDKFDTLWTERWRKQWNAMATWESNGMPVDPVLVNFAYSRIRRYVLRWGTTPGLSPESVGDTHYSN